MIQHHRLGEPAMNLTIPINRNMFDFSHWLREGFGEFSLQLFRLITIKGVLGPVDRDFDGWNGCLNSAFGFHGSFYWFKSRWSHSSQSATDCISASKRVPFCSRVECPQVSSLWSCTTSGNSRSNSGPRSPSEP